MKVLIVNQHAYAPFHHGGVRHYMLARELQRSGHEVLIVSTSFFHKSQVETRLQPDESQRLESIDGVRFLWLRIPPYRGNGTGRVRSMLAFSWRVASGLPLPAGFTPDVVYSSSPQLFSSVAAQFLAMRRGIPHVFEIRDLWPQTFIDLGRWRSSHPWIRLLDQLQRYLYRHADHVISTLPNAADYIVARGGRHEAITWITNGIDLQSIAPPGPLREQPRPFVLMHAGAHVESTGLDLALDAARVLKERGLGEQINLQFLGDGPEKARHQDRAAREQLTNVTFLDPVPKDRVEDVLRAADGFLLIRAPSPVHQWGISPHKLADYFAAGRPVVFCVDSPWNPVGEVAAGTTADPGDADSLASAIHDLARLPLEARQAMAKRGQAFVEREMDMRRLGRRLATVLSGVVSSRSRPVAGPRAQGATDR